MTLTKPNEGQYGWDDLLTPFLEAINGTIGPVADLAGDGTTDDAPAIQAALDDLPTTSGNGAGGKVTLLPGKVYGIGSTIEITNPATMLDGIVGGMLDTRGSCTLKALPGFTGPLIKINIGAGDKGAWVKNLKLDGNNEAGVTAGIEFATGTISVAHLFDIAITNVPTGIKTGSNCQSLVWERVLAAKGITTGIDIGADNRDIKIVSSRIGGTTRAAVVGTDTAVSGDNTELVSFDGCELYAMGTASSDVVLVRSSDNTRFTNCYVEVSTAQVSALDAMLVLGSTSGVAVEPAVMGCRLSGNSKANHAIHFANSTYPQVMGNGSKFDFVTTDVKNTAGTGGTVIGLRVDNSSGLWLSVGGTNSAAARIHSPLWTDQYVKTPGYATGSRPSAATLGARAQIFDTTLNKPIWSDGTNWRDATGTVV